MNIPTHLVGFRIYCDGSENLQGVADIELPSLEPISDTIKGAGIGGEIDVPIIGHFASMKIKLNWRNFTKEFLSMLKQTGQRLDCRGNIQVLNEFSQIDNVGMKVVTQVLPAKSELGKVEGATMMENTQEFEIVYLKITYDGQELVEIDKLNYICVIDGVDYLAKVRQNLGM